MDDCTISYHSKYIHTIEEKLQHSIHKINKCFMKTKTKSINFCNKYKLHDDLKLQLESIDIPVVDEYKFLGMTFNEKFYSHINYVKQKCNKKLQLLHIVAHINWEADR